MSKFIKAIKAELGPNRYASKIKIKNLGVQKEIIPSKYEPDLYDYNIGVNWVVGGKCKPEAFEEIKKQCIAQLRDIIYGEFKEMIFELYQAVWSEDEDKIKSCINVILDEVNGKNESN